MRLYLKEIWENEKIKRKHIKKKLAIVWAIILAASIFIGLSGAIWATNDGRAINIELLKIYKNYEWRMTGEINQEFVENYQKQYEYFVDKYRVSDEEIEAKKIEWDVNLPTEEILYDMEYEYVVLKDEFREPLLYLWPSEEEYWEKSVLENYQELQARDPELARDYVVFQGLSQEGRLMVHYAEDPVNCILNGTNFEYYPENLQKDFQKMAERYLADKPVVSGKIHGWDVRVCLMQVLAYTLSILILLTCCNYFATERQHNVQDSLATAKYGRKHLTVVKLLMAIRTSTFYWITFQAAFFIVVAVFLGVEGWNATYHAGLMDVPYGFTCLQYYLAQLVISYFGTIFFTLFVCMLSSVLPKIVTLLVGLGLIAATGYPILLHEFSDKSFSAAHKLKALMPTQLMTGFSTYRTYQGFAIGECVIRLPLASYLVIILGSAFCIWVICKRTKVFK